MVNIKICIFNMFHFYMEEIKMSNYSELLKDPRWQKKRLDIFNRDKFKCRSCEDTKKTLHVHHLYYDYKLKPWEYSDDDLVTLCEDCHNTIHSLGVNKDDFLFADAITRCVNYLYTLSEK